MQLEIACHNRNLSFSDMLEAIFLSSSESVNCISFPTGVISEISQEFKEHSKFAAVIDFPYGLNDTSLRIHEIILAARRGAKYIDLVISNRHLENENWRAIRDDIKHCSTVCKSNNIELRPLIEYRLYPEKIVLDLCEYLHTHGINFIINSTGTMLDDLQDNVVMSYLIESRTGVSVIACANILNFDQYDMFESSGIYGLRFISAKTAQNFI